MGQSGEGCPVCRGQRVGLAAPRHLAEWAQLNRAEQSVLLEQVGQALAGGVSGFRVSQAYGHFHLVPDIAARLTTGAADPLLPLLAQSIDGADQVDLAVAFAMVSGVQLIAPWFADLLARGGRLRIVVGDYMDVTEPAALQRLADLEGAEVSVFETGRGSFHPKTWLFRARRGHDAAIVGSSNLSRTALTTGVEWNLHSETAADAVAGAFAALLAHPQTLPLTPDWIAAYAARRRARPLTDLAQQTLSGEPSQPAPAPHAIQRQALAALGRTRQDGFRAGMVVLATGLGKTWTAAFDSRPFGRVLFVAHREEILSQAMDAFRRVRPEARFGRYDGSDKDMQAEILFASIQTLGRIGHLRRFAPDAFDYIVVDEFHHASAQSYRSLLDHFSPAFLLGLTATPDRTDGQDLLGLCGDNLVYRCDLFAGIEAGLLAPFRYFGVADCVDYAQIPWRSQQFDPVALEAALATQARAANALEQFLDKRRGPAIGFCCSQRHADFMADYFCAHGLRAVAVHAGAGSAPRATSLDQLGRGEVDVLFAVDMFNEGVDVPNIGTVLMLRPTESAILWLQQLGRGLRRVEGKVLQVIDYIGNHRTFLTKLRALLAAGPGDRSLSQRLEQVLDHRMDLPPGCEVTYDLQVIDILRDLLRTTPGMDDLEASYRAFRLRHGQRPTATEMHRMGFDPARNGHGGWFAFVRDMGDPVAALALTTVGDLLRRIERDRALTRPAVDALLSLTQGGAVEEAGLAHWAHDPLLARVGARLTLTRPDPGGAAAAMVAELADWRGAALPGHEADDAPAPFVTTGPQLWTEYPREEIPRMFGTTFNPGNWNAGIVRLDDRLILLTTLHKGNLSAGGHYVDQFQSPDRMQWQSQTQTRRDSGVGRVLSGQAGGQVHLFVRAGKMRGTKAAPFLYCGQPAFAGWQGDRPITVTWTLPQPVPPHWWPSLGIAG